MESVTNDIFAAGDGYFQVAFTVVSSFKVGQFVVQSQTSRSKVDLEEVQQTTNKIDQLDKPMAEPAFYEAQIENGKPSVPEDTIALRKLSRVIRSPMRYDFLIISDALLIEEDEPIIYAESKSNVDSKR
ncbi:Uncharacterized protein Adt_03372 [Abeliophyllum distichum]|uniref:GIL1/IRKI C-terminal domain-containing protein n=1 Tax=Abeliophyllum distichum TaxID=126358 RepID=A0ABD1VYC2_9LAMI